MLGDHYRRSPDELEQKAVKYWPAELSEQEAEQSILPILLRDHDKFLEILSQDFDDIHELFERIENSTIAANVFVKELALVTDIGGETMKRVTGRLANDLFPDGKLHYVWKGERRTYSFKTLPGTQLSNTALSIDGKGLIKEATLDDKMRDAIALMLFGNYSESEDIACYFETSEIATYIGKSKEVEKYLRQRYIQVSRITGGSKANSLGQMAEDYVRKFLTDALGSLGVELVHGSTIPGIIHRTDRQDLPTSFDIVFRKGNKYAAVEVSFQVTTNSTVERKAGQVKSRYEQMEAKGYKMTYVVDGAGNFERRSMLSTICSNSHCTVAFSDEELGVLAQFLRGYFG